MPIRPIDMQVMIPKSQQVSKITQNMFNRGEVALQQGLNEKKKEDEKKLKRVNKNQRQSTEKLLNKKPKNNYGSNKKLDENDLNSHGSRIDIKL